MPFSSRRLRAYLSATAHAVGSRVLPGSWPRVQADLRRLLRPARLGVLAQGRPLSHSWGSERGEPIDRYYIERFLAEHAADVRGRVLEVKNSAYTRRFGHDVVAADVLDIDPTNREATVVGDLSRPDFDLPDCFDCFILTQTMQFIFDVRAAVYQAHRLLKPGGVLLVTVPSVSRISPKTGLTGEYWRFTVASCHRLLEEAFGAGTIEVRSYGNLTSAVAFLAGAAQEDLRRVRLDRQDDYFPVIIAARAVKRLS